MKLKNVANDANQVMVSRSSIREYDPLCKISREEMSNILQDATTAPSSLNLQPWRFVIVESDEAKEQIKPYMQFNQIQCETASAIIAVFGDYDNFAYTDSIYSGAVKHEIMTQEAKEKMVQAIEGYRNGASKEKIKEVFLFDCGLVSMQIMQSAKAYGYDTNAIGGFQKEELTKALEMDAERYFPVILISIGKAVGKQKGSVRFSIDRITEWK